jgi:hypothetical protein
MPTQFPLALDDFANPTSSSSLSDSTVLHSEQHANANDAIEAIQRRIGVTNSTDPASLTKRVNDLLIASGAYVTSAQLNTALTGLTAGGSAINIDYTGLQDGAVLVYDTASSKFVVTTNLEKQNISGGQY